MKNIFSIRISGGAMYYALFVMIVLGVISTMLLGYMQLSFQQDTLFYQHNRLNDNAGSAIELICAYPDKYDFESNTPIDLFDDNKDTVMVSISRWGVLRKINVHHHWHHLFVKKTVLASETEAHRYAIWIPDMGTNISLVGNSYVQGDCKMPISGLRKGSAEGKNFEGPFLHKGKIVKSSSKMIEPSDSWLSYIDSLIQGNFQLSDTVVSITQKPIPVDIKQRFDDRTLVFEKRGNLILTKGSFSGNIIIFASDTLRLGSGVSMDKVIVVAKTIEIDDGYNGCIQAIAQQSIVVGKNSQLSYPSFLIVSNSYPDAKVDINEQCEINGGVLVFSTDAQPTKTMIALNENAIVKGKIYVNGDVMLKGNVWGGVYTTGFIYDAPRAFYRNFIFDGYIDAEKIPNDYGTFCLNGELNHLTVVSHEN